MHKTVIQMAYACGCRFHIRSINNKRTFHHNVKGASHIHFKSLLALVGVDCVFQIFLDIIFVLAVTRIDKIAGFAIHKQG